MSKTCRETYINTKHIARSFPLPQEIDANTTPTISTETMNLLPCRECITFHLLPPADPLNVLSLRKYGQIAVPLTDTTITVLDGNMPAVLLGQFRVRKAKAYGALDYY